MKDPTEYTPAELAGGLMMIGARGLDSAAIAARCEEFKAGGFIVFRRNVESPVQLAEFTGELHARAAERKARLLVGVDQEGGRVFRLDEPFCRFPPALCYGNFLRDNPDVDHGANPARLFGEIQAAELAAVGINLDFAPVADIDTNRDNPVIGDRAFGDDAELVARVAADVIAGLQEGAGPRVAACAKHFPGHGDTSADSHHELPRVAADAASLDSRELIPFRAAAEAGVATMMTAHVIYEGLDPHLPATLSKACLDLLRVPVEDGGAGYDGVLITDDLEMKAVELMHGAAEAAVMSVQAGCDIVLICHEYEKQGLAWEALTKAIIDGEIPRARAERSLMRILEVKQRFAAEEGGTGIDLARFDQPAAERSARLYELLGPYLPGGPVASRSTVGEPPA